MINDDEVVASPAVLVPLRRLVVSSISEYLSWATVGSMMVRFNAYFSPVPF